MRFLLPVLLASSLARGEAVPASADPAAASGIRAGIPGDRILMESRSRGIVPVDLDFDDDFPTPYARRMKSRIKAGARLPASLPARAPAPASRDVPESPSWMYWAIGLSVATGGLAWYLHREFDTPPGPSRTEEVFTDEPD